MSRIPNRFSHKYVRLSRRYPLIDQVVVVIPLQHEANVVDAELIVTVQDQRSAEVLIDDVARWDAELCDANGRCIDCKLIGKSSLLKND